MSQNELLCESCERAQATRAMYVPWYDATGARGRIGTPWCRACALAIDETWESGPIAMIGVEMGDALCIGSLGREGFGAALRAALGG